MEKVRYMISDAANIVNVESHVLRYWEDELALNVPRNEMGHRYYTKENIQEFQRIKELKEQGYQLKAIRMIVHNGSMDQEAKESAPGAAAQEKAPDLRQIPMPQSQPAAESQAAVQSQGTVQNKAAASGTAQNQGHQSIAVVPAKDVPARESHQSILDNTDKMAQFTDLMTQIVGKAIAANNGELSRNISEDVGEQVVKEMNYLMREREEAEEERFRKLDAAIRGNLKKKGSEKRKWKKKRDAAEPEGI